MVPTLPTLSRIAMVFDVGLDHFFTGPLRLFNIVREGERMRFPERADAPTPAYFFECLAFSTQGKGLHAYLATFPKRTPDQIVDHFHEGTELIYVLSGSLNIRFQGEEHDLRAGDTLHMDSIEPHGYRGTSDEDARAIIVTLPPRL
jgi:quercetin dioxygenase-like cupin family protein